MERTYPKVTHTQVWSFCCSVLCAIFQWEFPNVAHGLFTFPKKMADFVGVIDALAVETVPYISSLLFFFRRATA